MIRTNKFHLFAHRMHECKVEIKTLLSLYVAFLTATAEINFRITQR